MVPEGAHALIANIRDGLVFLNVQLNITAGFREERVVLPHPATLLG